jgi:hypothetical protein
MRNKQAVFTLFIIAGLVTAPFAAFAETRAVNPVDTGGVMCTADAKICPDGSGVGRVPPSCEFAACPSSTKSSVGLPTTPTTPPPFGEIKRGVTSDKVKDLQTVLKSDPAIYSGPVTGYYGPMTEEAIKKLQAKFGLPQTGILDATTQNYILPYYDTRIEISIISPNGGEIWKAGEMQKILWKAAFGPTPIPEPVAMMGSGASTMTATTVAGNSGAPSKMIAPFFPRATLDLIRDGDPSFVRHIGTVNLYESSRVWKVPAGLPEAKDYRVRIALGGETPCLYRAETEAAAQGRLDTTLVYPCPMMKGGSATGANAMMYPAYSTSDQSDNSFAILGGGGTDDRIEALKRQLVSIQEMLMKIQEQVRLLNLEIQKLQGQ